MKLIRKEYERPFIVEPTKLTRLLERMHERLADHPDVQQRDGFEVFLSGSRTEETNTLDEVLAIENTRRHAVLRMIATSSAKHSASTTSEHQIEVDFDGRDKSKATITVRSDASAWASRVLSELEEQVERTGTRDMGGRGAVLGLLVVFVVIS